MWNVHLSHPSIGNNYTLHKLNNMLNDREDEEETEFHCYLRLGLSKEGKVTSLSFPGERGDNVMDSFRAAAAEDRAAARKVQRDFSQSVTRLNEPGRVRVIWLIEDLTETAEVIDLDRS